MLKLVAKGVKMSSLLKPLLLLPWIATLISFALLTAWLDSQLNCFPVTVITTSHATVSSVQNSLQHCFIDVSQENMTVDSRLLNDNERPSVKSIWLITMTIPYDDVESLQLLPETEIEMNNFVKESATTWQKSRLKTLVVLFFIATIFGIILALMIPFSANKIGISKKSSHILYTLWLLTLILPALIVSYSSPFFVATLLSTFTVMLTALLFQILHNHSLVDKAS
ncbi:hypothetical protein KAH37_09435 [bacterium]|nr:hypothetical protein [bacterium]